MEKIHRDCSIRLIVGLVINLAIVIPALGVIGGGYINLYADDTGDSHFQIALIAGIAAAISLLVTARILWRGVSWQQVAAVLLVPIPAILLFDIFRFCFLYWNRGY
jgi:hypothetical protein